GITGRAQEGSIMSMAVVKHGDYTVTFESPDELLDEALSFTGVIGKATTPEENDIVGRGQRLLDVGLKLSEERRVAIKEPFLMMGRKIDKWWKERTAAAVAESLRLGVIAADYAALEKAKLKAGEAARIVELCDLDRRRQTEVSAANTLDEIDEIQARYDEEVKTLPPLPPPDRAEGQRITEGWDITGTHPHAPARFHPNCVKITALIGEITIMLNQGLKVAGIIATPKIKAGVRTTSKDAIINI